MNTIAIVTTLFELVTKTDVFRDLEVFNRLQSGKDAQLLHLLFLLSF